jgi:hypothetical protein
MKSIIIISLLALLLFKIISDKNTPTIEYVTDTVYIEKNIPVIEIKEVVKPQVVKIYIRDSLAREAAENGNIITGIESKKKKLNIHTIQPNGIPSIAEYNIPHLPAFKIDGQGRVEFSQKELKKIKRRQQWRKIGNTALIAGAFVVGVLAAN